METLQYEQAIEVYQKLHKKNAEAIEPLIGLAMAHHKLKQLEDAAHWYAEALKLPEVDAAIYYEYGHVLFQQGACQAAQFAFNEFLRRKPYDERQNDLQDVCALYERLQSGSLTQTQISQPDFNGLNSDLAPAFFHDGLVFGSVRTGDKRKGAYYDLFYTRPLAEDRPDGLSLSYEPIEGFSEMLNSGFNEAIVTFSPDYSEVYFTSNQAEAASEKRPVRRLEIMVSRMGADSSWSTPEALGLNSPNYSAAHPALSPDGQRLFFSSDRPGGFGGKDLYYSDRVGLGWSSPINLGPKINTEGDELFPYYHSDGELYFASDGQLGLGGLDIFRVEDLGEGQWGSVQNPGRPINSTADDFALILKADGTYGFLTSNRPGGKGSDDIYAFQKRKVRLEIHFYEDESTRLEEGIALAIRGEDYLVFADESGSWTTWLSPDDCRYIRVRDERFKESAMEICASSASSNEDELMIKWVLEPANDSPWANTDGEKMLEGILLDELTGEPIPMADLSLNGTDCTLRAQITTDKRGYFSYLAEEECCFDLLTSTDGYFSGISATPYCSANWPQRDTIYLAPYRLQGGQELASTTAATSDFQVGSKVYQDADRAIPYLLNVYYDLGRASVRPEAIPELNRLYWLLDRNPDIVVEIGSHTDARGTDAFNYRLSQRRANAIVRFLVSKGIAGARLQAKGYGETRPVNGCENGVDCTEDEHQLNRRTEFRVIAERMGQNNR